MEVLSEVRLIAAPDDRCTPFVTDVCDEVAGSVLWHR
jgi:hypothetical protein